MATEQKIAEKLRGLAEKMQSQIDHKMDSNRLTNTRRRQMIAASLRREGKHVSNPRLKSWAYKSSRTSVSS